jgi:hypothetical protein
MKAPILTLRLSRRALAAVVLHDEQLTFYDGRHLRSDPPAALRAVVRYARLVVDQTRPSTVIIDCPAAKGGGTEPLLQALEAMLRQDGLPVHHVTAVDILHAYGTPGVPSRIELRRIVAPIFPELASVTARVATFVADAAAAALYVEAGAALSTFPA